MVVDEKKFDSLCSHYKDTYEIHVNTIKQIDGLFYGLLAVIALFALQSFPEGIVTAAVSEYFKQSSGVKLGDSIIQLLLWFAMLGWTLKYFQAVVAIERQYIYLHYLERELNIFYHGSDVFTMESKSYLKSYPWFSRWMWVLYTTIFPAAIAISACFQIFEECKAGSQNLLIDGFCCLAIVVSVILYMLHLHKGI